MENKQEPDIVAAERLYAATGVMVCTALAVVLFILLLVTGKLKVKEATVKDEMSLISLREDEAGWIRNNAERCKECGHLMVFHLRQFQGICIVEGCPCGPKTED